jgi:hypothetical protein
MIRCKTCVMPNTRPDTPFIGGECSACVSYRKRATIDWVEREAELKAILASHGNRCIVPSSGGKDSTWQVLKLLELGADVTVVTAKTMLCGNCSAFDVSDSMRDCMAKGIKGDESNIDANATINLADLGYCNFLHFKCAGSRSCKAWVTGGPITEKDKGKSAD